MRGSVITVDTLSVAFRRGRTAVEVVSGVSFAIRAGEIFAVAGESGCGKSVTCLALTRLLPPRSTRYRGRVEVGGVEALSAPERMLRRVRGRVVSYVFQEPGAALNPVLRVRTQLEECRVRATESDGAAKAPEQLLEEVGIPDPRRCLAAYPHQLSGGMKQRVMLAMALAHRPQLLVADEPTTALDVTVQARILDLIADIRSRTGMAVLLVSHDFGVVGGLADRVAVMYAGQIVELASTADLLANPLHPYTRALLDAVPRLDGARPRRLRAIPGRVPPPWSYPAGCRFAPRCPLAGAECRQTGPPLIMAGPGHSVRCFAYSGREQESRAVNDGGAAADGS